MLREKDDPKSKILKLDEINIIAPCGFGDTMILCGFKNALESLYSEKIHFIIQPKHEVVMEMYNISDYSIQSFSEDELYILGKHNKIPTRGSLFVAHPLFLEKKELLEEFNKNKFSFIDLHRKNLNLSSCTEFELPTSFPQLTEELKAKVEEIAPLERVVLISPESHSLKAVNPIFFEKIVKSLKMNGYTVISSVCNIKNRVKGSIYLKLDIKEALALGTHCGEIYATRSGFCDLMALTAKNLTVFYPDHDSFKIYGLKTLFRNKFLPNEIVVIGSILSKVSPFLLIEKKNQETVYRLCLQLFRIKKTQGKKKLYILGIPIYNKNL